jgi:3-phytase
MAMIGATSIVSLQVALSSCALASDEEGPVTVTPRPPTSASAPGAAKDTTVVATAETADLPSSKGGDIADDSAIWVDSGNPARSVVIGDSKDDREGGVAVYDTRGSRLQFLPAGPIGNIDLRPGFRLGGRDVVLVGANNRSNDTLSFWTLDPGTRSLTPVAGSGATLAPNYGFCLYRNATSGTTYAFVSQAETGTFQQFELSGASGSVEAREVRRFDVGSQAEGCVADDETGALYVAEEDVGLWRYGADPGAGDARRQVDSVASGHLKADVEGVSLARGPGGGGYLIVSSQGNSRLAVYDRGGNNAFRKSFEVSANGSIDGVESTDGVEVTTANAGPGFEQGLLVVHDAENRGGKTSNVKLVPFQEVLAVPDGS